MMTKPQGLKPVQGLLSVYQNIQKQKVPFPADGSFMHKDAADALHAASVQILDNGGRLYLSSVWRTPDQQFKAWLDFQTGSKSSYSPPPGLSMHECGRAVDIDTRAEQLKIPHEKVREILAGKNWFPVAELGEPGDNHYEYRDPILQKEKATNGYIAMVKAAFAAGKYTSIEYSGTDDGLANTAAWL